SSGNTITVDGVPVLVAGTVATYRYFFTGYRSGTLTATFIAGGWSDTAGNAVTSAQLSTASADTSGNLPARTHPDVTFTPTNDAEGDGATTLDAAAEFTLTGGGSENLVPVGVVRIDATTFRYLSLGDFDTGTIRIAFIQGSWADDE